MADLTSELKKQRALVDWLSKSLTNYRVVLRDIDREYIGCIYLQLAIEHHKSIVMLCEHKYLGSAFSLARLIYETFSRGLYIRYCADDDEIADFMKHIEKKEFYRGPRFEDIVHAISDMLELDEEDPMKNIYRTWWHMMNDFTHAGSHHLMRRFSPSRAIGSVNYSDDDIIKLLQLSGSLATWSAMFMTEHDPSKFESIYAKLQEHNR